MLPGSRLASLRALDRAPHGLGRVGHVEMADAERAQRVDDGVRDRRGAGDRAGLTHPLYADRVDRRRRDRLVELDLREVRRPWQRVVEHGARQELALVVVDRALPQRLADALGDATVELPID